jgi:cellulose synthase/poly-beta-1,6-N-acetylglucosamine synthase-like glycosyltransferase
LGEDLDMGLELIRQGEHIHFNPEPVVYAIMPTHASGATSQRVRWEGGRFASMKHRVPTLLKEAWRKKNLDLFEAAIDTAFPPLALLLVVVTLFVLFNAALVWFGVATLQYVLWGWLAVFGMMVVHCVVGLMLAKVHPRALLAFLYVPRYLIWKVGVYISMLIGKTNKTWVRTER